MDLNYVDLKHKCQNIYYIFCGFATILSSILVFKVIAELQNCQDLPVYQKIEKSGYALYLGGWLVVWLFGRNAGLTLKLLWSLEMSRSTHISLRRRHIRDISGT